MSNEQQQQVASWQHLKKFGYAPGGYSMRCADCKNIVYDCDKRASCCKACAEKLHAAEEKAQNYAG